MSEIYLDNAATTPMTPVVIDEMTKQMKESWGNASTGYSFGRHAKLVMEDSRHVIAQSINAADNEIIFTSGGTESDNTAIIQTAFKRQNLGKHIITTAVEHEAVLKPLHFLADHGFEVTYLPVDENGNISIDDFKAALRDDTILVTIMMENNEVGSQMPIHEIGEILKDHQAWFHTDAVQAYGLMPIDVKADHIDMLSTSAHKINGPKMIGFLYRRDGISFPSFIKGGDQETKRRAGTENVPGIAAFAKAVELNTSAVKKERRNRYYDFKQKIVRALEENNIDFAVNGLINQTHVLNLWFKGISTYVMQTDLDLAGIAVSGGSACTAGSIEPSHVLTAMFGADSPRISESIRVSFGALNTEQDIDRLIKTVIKTTQKLKQINGED
ncbi:cysteine desulfurase [Lactobacillus sp. 0.1XD8-4]|uniref:cysteine desulfurase family protein n=1 Tax=uncultured Limosilactobacillus sp. TaxID=2837629 RepID=UPI00272B66B6|nr:cysteine desulfurase family protein [uncultured Limosilactobacillus sp.]MRN06331.1 cysteine desulfurase [Lactobacillus sp. 0.1XD8-4]